MTNGKISSYRDLKVWQFAIELSVVVCYEVTRTFPREEIYGMTSQIRRSSASVAANIAEGYGRENRGSFAQFLKIAQGSLKELETHLIIAGRIGLLQASALLGSLIRSVQHRKADE
ncbi:S23 ribosomal RNA-associated protein [Rhizobium etli bv. phaseoli str. IE4803]|nr:S23 ribosomal RNA-associated protein [Rhizobium etli bv. phaseoli str. IE4803]